MSRGHRLRHHGPSVRFPAAAAAAAALLLTTACSSLTGDGKSDYRQQAGKTAPLDIPPDLSQLARDGRFRPASGVVSAAAAQAGGAPQGSVTAVAPVAVADVRVERDRQQRWLVVARPPEQVWPLVRSFWLDSGFTLETENAQTGVLETAWKEDRSRLPKDLIRSTLGRVFEGLYDSGLRDRFRTRLERTASGGTEIYISHRRIEEVYASPGRDSTRWLPQPADPQVEAETLSRLMTRLTQQSEPAARQQVVSAAAPAASPAPAVSADARLELDDGFDRAWRRVGLALDRGGFSVEDRDRAAGLYFVRYVDPGAAGREEPGFFSRLFSGDKGPTIVRYRVLVEAKGTRTAVSLQSTQGAPETGDTAKRILSQLAEGLR